MRACEVCVARTSSSTTVSPPDQPCVHDSCRRPGDRVLGGRCELETDVRVFAGPGGHRQRCVPMSACSVRLRDVAAYPAPVLASAWGHPGPAAAPATVACLQRLDRLLDGRPDSRLHRHHDRKRHLPRPRGRRTQADRRAGGWDDAERLPCLSPDGRMLAYGVASPQGRAVVVVGVDADGVVPDASGTTRPPDWKITRHIVVPGPGRAVCARWSTDGTRLAYLDGRDRGRSRPRWFDAGPRWFESRQRPGHPRRQRP